MSSYKLVNKVPVPCDITEDQGDRRVNFTEAGGVKVSTVFLGINHRYGSGPPILFETMVFGGGEAWDDYQKRYCTWDEAAEGHAEICKQVLGMNRTINRVIKNVAKIREQ